MTSSSGLTIFVPVCNEETLLSLNTNRLITFLNTLDIPYEIVIGSNGSSDRTVDLGQKLSARNENIHFFHLPRKGVGAAFREGIRISKHERIVSVDMDLSTNLEFIREAYLLLGRYDFVIGSKITGNQERSWIRRMASNCFISLAGLMFHINFHDYSIAAKGYRKDLVERYLAYVDDKTFYVFQIAYRAFHDGKKITEIPVRCHDMRKSRFNLIHEGIYKYGNLLRLWLFPLEK